MNIATLNSPKTIAAQGLIDFSKYPIDEDGYNTFLEDFNLLAKSKNQVIKDNLRNAGGYRRIFDLADEYFSADCNTVNWVTGRFFELAEAKDGEAQRVKGDERGHRFTVKDRFNTDWNCFQYASDFFFALCLALENN